VALFQLTARINRKGGTMREIIGAAALTLAITPALAASELDPKVAADFVLSTCLPALEDPENIEKLAQDNSWSRLPDPSQSELLKQKAWNAPNSFYVGITEAPVPDKGTLLSCYVGFIPHKMDRDELLATISGSVELTLVSDAVRSLVRHEIYSFAGRNLKLSFTSKDGAVWGVWIGSVR
jgi:hypothetical protein